MWTIHQPRPRAAGSRTLRYLTLVFIFLLTFRFTIETFQFLNDPPEPPQQNQLLTPSSSPEPRPPVKRLTIPDIISSDEHFRKNNTLQTAVDTFEKAAFPGNAVLMFDQTEEGEYLLSARPWEVGECRRANQELWNQLEGHTRPPSAPPAHEPIARPAALSYLTPPSSPEPLDRRKVAPIAHVDPPNVPEPTIPSDLSDFSSSLPADHVTNESLEYLSDYDYEDEEWTVESPCIPTEELPGCELEPNCASDCYNGGMRINSERPVSPALPMGPSPFNRFDPSTACGSLLIQDLTSQLDASKFSEWPIARGGFGEVWKGALTVNGTIGNQGRPIAVKRLTMYTATGDEGARKIERRTARELSIWSRLKHPNILPLLGTCSFRGSIGIVSEWQENGNATEWVRKNPSVSRLKLCEGICAGLAYLHRSGVVHGDLRGGNVTISETGVPRLIDFGMASRTEGSLCLESSTLAGTLRWLAPELQVTEGQGTTTAGDMFAFGMTILELFTGLPPFSAVHNDIAVLLKYQKGDRPPRPSCTKGNIKSLNWSKFGTRAGLTRERGIKKDVCVPMDDETWRQVQRCWDQDPLLRPSANEMLEWFMRKKKRRYYDL